MYNVMDVIMIAATFFWLGYLWNKLRYMERLEKLKSQMVQERRLYRRLREECEDE